MASGGARAKRNAPDPNSERSALRGLVFTQLPAEGFQGEIPEFPLAELELKFKAGEMRGEVDFAASHTLREAQSRLWEQVWRTPQACVWAVEPWRQYNVAQYVRTAALCETEYGTAADKAIMLRLAEEVGLTQAGMARNGWALGKTVANAEAEDRVSRESGKGAGGRSGSARDRMKVIAGGKR